MGDHTHGDDVDDPTGRLAAYLARTRTPLDLLALLTLWIVLVPPGKFGGGHDFSTIAVFVRVGLSVVYGIDMAIRSTLAKRHWHYLRSNPLSVVAVAFPPVRVVFSVRLIKSVFSRGNLDRFLIAAAVLVLNGAVIVYLYERHAPGSNIHTLRESVWWSVTTVTTVGYGDYFPVTTGGRITAGLIMVIGILTVAVVTAQVASAFVEQAARRRASDTSTDAGQQEASLAELARRLDRIEALLAARLSEPEPPSDP